MKDGNDATGQQFSKMIMVLLACTSAKWKGITDLQFRRKCNGSTGLEFCKMGMTVPADTLKKMGNTPLSSNSATCELQYWRAVLLN
jgi:hypothetical protein